MATTRGGAKRLAHLLGIKTRTDLLEAIAQAVVVQVLWRIAGPPWAIAWVIVAAVLHGLRDASRST